MFALTPAQIEVIKVLGQGGEITQFHYAKAQWHIREMRAKDDKSLNTKTVLKLVALGLVMIVNAARQNRLVITPNGEAEYRRLFPSAPAIEPTASPKADDSEPVAAAQCGFVGMSELDNALLAMTDYVPNATTPSATEGIPLDEPIRLCLIDAVGSASSFAIIERIYPNAFMMNNNLWYSDVKMPEWETAHLVGHYNIAWDDSGDPDQSAASALMADISEPVVLADPLADVEYVELDGGYDLHHDDGSITHLDAFTLDWRNVMLAIEDQGLERDGRKYLPPRKTDARALPTDSGSLGVSIRGTDKPIADVSNDVLAGVEKAIDLFDVYELHYSGSVVTVDSVEHFVRFHQVMLALEEEQWTRRSLNDGTAEFTHPQQPASLGNEHADDGTGWELPGYGEPDGDIAHAIGMAAWENAHAEIARLQTELADARKLLHAVSAAVEFDDLEGLFKPLVKPVIDIWDYCETYERPHTTPAADSNPAALPDSSQDDQLTDDEAKVLSALDVMYVDEPLAYPWAYVRAAVIHQQKAVIASRNLIQQGFVKRGSEKQATFTITDAGRRALAAHRQAANQTADDERAAYAEHKAAGDGKLYTAEDVLATYKGIDDDPEFWHVGD